MPGDEFIFPKRKCLQNYESHVAATIPSGVGIKSANRRRICGSRDDLPKFSLPLKAAKSENK